jgi:hypothetical protein
LTKDSDATLPEILIQPCPFGQRTPPIPTAQSITIVRVASPVSTQRKYQPIILRALRKYFEGKRRLLVKGDLIAVAVDTSNASIFEDGLDGAEVKTKQESLDEIIDLSVLLTFSALLVHLGIGLLQDTEFMTPLPTFVLQT